MASIALVFTPSPIAYVLTAGDCASSLPAPHGPSQPSTHCFVSSPSVSKMIALVREASCSVGSPASAASDLPVLVSGSSLSHRYLILPALVSCWPSLLPWSTVVARKSRIAPPFMAAIGTTMLPAEQPPGKHDENVS